MKQAREKKRSKKRLILVIVVLAAAVVGILLFTGALGGKDAAMFAQDEKAQTGALDMESQDAQQALDELQSAVDASKFSFRINSRPAFESGSGEGTLMIENPADNRYDMQVTITLDETGATLYETGLISPNSNIARDKLQTPMPAGEFPATATITAYENGEKVGQVMTGMVIQVTG